MSEKYKQMETCFFLQFVACVSVIGFLQSATWSYNFKILKPTKTSVCAMP